MNCSMLLTFVTVGHGSILQGTSKYTDFENVTVNIDVEAIVWTFLALKLHTCYTVSYTTYKYYIVYIIVYTYVSLSWVIYWH